MYDSHGLFVWLFKHCQFKVDYLAGGGKEEWFGTQDLLFMHFDFPQGTV